MNPAAPAMTPLQRVEAALAHREPDRVPLILPLVLQGAREMGVPIPDYFRRPGLMAEAQVRLRRRYGHDALVGAAYAAVDLEAFGGRAMFFEDGPPNAGPPTLKRPEDILRLEPPRVEDCPALARILDLQQRLALAGKGEVPVVGSLVAPFSLAVLQLGFERFMDLLQDGPELLARLLAVNEAFAGAWARAQFRAGATAVACADPMGSATVVTHAQYLAVGLPSLRRLIQGLPGPAVIHLASARALPTLADLAATGAVAVGVGPQEDLAVLKAAAGQRIALLGNLDGLAMRTWTPAQAEAQVAQAIAKAAAGGGFLLSDGHGEIPWQVPDAVLEAVAAAARRWGRYPLQARDPEEAP